MSRALLLLVRNEMAPQASLDRAEIDAGLTVSQAVAAQGWQLPAGVDLIRDGIVVARPDWDVLPIREGEIVTLADFPHGGGKGGSNIIQIAAQLALLVLSYVLFGPTGAVTTSIGLTAFSIAQLALQATFYIAGQALLSVLLPPPKPPAGIGSPSPTYSLSAQGNRARINEPIPEWFGRFDIYPDLASQPYFEYEDDELILKEVFCCGMGSFERHQARVSDTVVWEDGSYTGNYPSIELEFVEPGSPVTLFADNVITSIEIDSIHLLHTDEDGYDWSGPFIGCPPGAVATDVGIDILIPGGLYRVGDSGDIDPTSVTFTFQAQQIDDSGTPIGDWFDLLTDEELNLQQINPVRRSYKEALPAPMRFQSRGQCTSAKLDQSDHHNTLYWGSMRAYLPQSPADPDVSKTALKAKATSGLNGTTAQKYNQVQTRILPLYDPETQTWSDPVATRSIAAAASHILRGDNWMKLPDSRIDLAALWALDVTWSGRGDSFDGGFDAKQGMWDSLQQVLGCGRTRALQAGSKIAFVRDEPRTAPATGFNPRNMTQGSFGIDYVHHDDNAVDAVLAVFINEDTWTQDQILCALPGSALTEDTAPQLNVFGIVNRDQVWRESIYRVAANIYRRVFPSFSTGRDGRVVMFGSPVRVSHHIAKWGASASATALQQGPSADGVFQDILTMSEPWSPAAEEDPTLYLEMLTPDGRVYGPVTIALLDDGTMTGQARVQLLQAMDPGGKYAGKQPREWPVWEGAGLQMERPRVTLATATLKAMDCLVLSMRPSAGSSTEVVTVIDDPRVYDADADGPPGPLDITSVDFESLGHVGGYTTVRMTVAGAPEAIDFLYVFDAGPSFTEPRVYEKLFLTGVAFSLSIRARGVVDGELVLGDWFDGDPYTPT
jgi:hypothetical protein